MRIGSKTYTPFNLAWAAEQKARYEHADAEPRMHHGKEFTKTLALACPWCSSVFFTWQAVGAETEPYVDPTTFRDGMGQRHTCGHPICHEKEQVYQMKQTKDYKKSCDEYYASKEKKPEVSFKPKAKLTKLGE